MADKDKSKLPQSKNFPKDGQVIMAIMKEMGVSEFEPKTIVQLTEFVYKYGTCILEEARLFANNNSNNKKRHLELDDVKLALELTSENSFVMPPSREDVLECARNKNSNPLPIVKPHCGLRLPPDRHCLSSPNYILKNTIRKMNKSSFHAALKVTPKPTISYIKRTNTPGIMKQTVTIPKPITKITTNIKVEPKVKTQISQNISMVSASPPAEIFSQVNTVTPSPPAEIFSQSESSKRKREDEFF